MAESKSCSIAHVGGNSRGIRRVVIGNVDLPGNVIVLQQLEDAFYAVHVNWRMIRIAAASGNAYHRCRGEKYIRLGCVRVSAGLNQRSEVAKVVAAQ